MFVISQNYNKTIISIRKMFFMKTKSFCVGTSLLLSRYNSGIYLMVRTCYGFGQPLGHLCKHEENEYNLTSYYFENGLRKVFPYYYTYRCYAKQRWLNKTLVEAFAQEFSYRTVDDFEEAIATGYFLLNGLKPSEDHRLRSGDKITLKIHRHENPVLDTPIKILYLDDSIVVADKPASLPVHPCGRYRYNSLKFILAKEFGICPSFSSHRLDRLTSGVVLCPRNIRVAQELSKDFTTRRIQKYYVCRVEGKFMEGEIVCREPLQVLCRRNGVSIVHSQGKDSETVFKRISYNGKSSVVLCQPLTGRTHQIRVHLQYLGYPIVNDRLYNSTLFGHCKGKGGVIGKSYEHLLNDIYHAFKYDNCLEESVKENNEGNKVNNVHSSVNQIMHDPICKECKKLIINPEPKNNQHYLHALKYVGPNWEYSTDMPDWAASDWEEPDVIN